MFSAGRDSPRGGCTGGGPWPGMLRHGEGVRRIQSCGPFGFGVCEDASLYPCNPYEDVLVPSSGSGEPPQGDAVEEGAAHGGLSSLCPLSGTTKAVGDPWAACALGTPSLAGRTWPLE